MEIRILASSERDYTYSAFQDQGRDESAGCIGHLRADFGSGGKGFYSSWTDHIAGLKSPAFKAEIDEVINALRADGFLAGREAMAEYCYSNPEASYGNDREWGVRVDTERYAYLMRLNPRRGEYNLYCYCYERDRLDRHLQAERSGVSAAPFRP